jgi:hypothetical protein
MLQQTFKFLYKLEQTYAEVFESVCFSSHQEIWALAPLSVHGRVEG